MALDVDIPNPPSLRGPEAPGDYEAVDEPEDRTGDDYRRAELAGFLREGAWEDAFEEWAAHTFMTEDEFRIVRDLDLIEGFDFYWDPATEDVGYRAPTLPDDLPPPHDDALDARDVEGIEEELDALGRTASEALENDYVHRDGEEFGFFSDEAG